MMILNKWRLYSSAERRNIAIYVLGIMFYKFGLEFYDGSMTVLALLRWKNTGKSESGPDPEERNPLGYYGRLGTARGINQAAQYVGAILAAPLVDRFKIRTVLASAVLFFGLMTSVLLIVDATTGGKRLGPSDRKAQEMGGTKANFGAWSDSIIFPIWMLNGVAYGMVELIRRVIPRDIVGGNIGKLRRMDAITHLFYETAGTIAAITSYAIQYFGANYSYFLTPVFFIIASAIWSFVITLDSKSGDDYTSVPLQEIDRRRRNYLVQVFHRAISYARSACVGAMYVFGHRKLVWLLPSYALAFYLHRFLENSLAPAFANSIFKKSDWSQILVAGSNIGELFGALSVFLLSDIVTTPMPWLRLDALMLNIVWILPYFSMVATGDLFWAWRVAGCFIPISWGWAAGDVSLAAYIQSALSSPDYIQKFAGVSPLAAVMAFLYSSYIVINAILSAQLGGVLDHSDIHVAFVYVGGIQYSVCCVIILLATFIPRGSFAFNPKAIEGVTIDGEPEICDPALDDEFDGIKLIPQHISTPVLDQRTTNLGW